MLKFAQQNVWGGIASVERTLERITDAHKARYDREGYLLIRKLIPEDVVDRAERAIHRVIRNYSELATQTEFHHQLHAPAEELDLISIFSPEFRETAARLSGDDPYTFAVPRQPWALVIFPYGTEWRWPDPHVDHALLEDQFKIFPLPFRIASISYLTDVPSHGGGTIVWPGSHKKLEAFVKRNRKDYRYMSDLNLNLQKIPLNPPVELKPRRGDVLFYHALCAHSAGMNVSDIPRLALGKKW